MTYDDDILPFLKEKKPMLMRLNLPKISHLAFKTPESLLPFEFSFCGVPSYKRGQLDLLGFGYLFGIIKKIIFNRAFPIGMDKIEYVNLARPNTF